MRDFNHSINVLIQAYLKDKLVSQDHCGCAMAHLIDEAHGERVTSNGLWMNAIWENRTGNRLVLKEFLKFPVIGGAFEKSIIIGTKQIEATGYTVEEAGKIEAAFEQRYSNEDGEWSINPEVCLIDRLSAVIDVLAEIHGVDLATRENCKRILTEV